MSTEFNDMTFDIHNVGQAKQQLWLKGYSSSTGRLRRTRKSGPDFLVGARESALIVWYLIIGPRKHVCSAHYNSTRSFLAHGCLSSFHSVYPVY